MEKNVGLERFKKKTTQKRERNSIQRMKKDRYLRKKHLNKLKQNIENSPNLTKNDLKSPYKKYLDLENKDCKLIFKLNDEKVQLDEKLDGIKGYLTNNFKL
jgi:hypothetical protein